MKVHFQIQMIINNKIIICLKKLSNYFPFLLMLLLKKWENKGFVDLQMVENLENKKKKIKKRKIKKKRKKMKLFLMKKQEINFRDLRQDLAFKIELNLNQN